LTVRPYQEGDEIQIHDLDQRVLYSPWNTRDLENWKWKFSDRNPLGHAIIWVMEKNGELIAHFAAIPYKFKVFDREVVASNAIGSLVDARYQNRGLMKIVGDRLFSELEQKKIPFTYGFPNTRAHEFQKIVFGFTDLISFDTWNICLHQWKRNKRNRNICRIRKFDRDFDRLWEECAADYRVAVVRRSDYLNWRFIARPDWDYYPLAFFEHNIPKGYAVLKLYREGDILRGHIVDIFAALESEELFFELISESMSFFQENGVDEVTSWAWGNPFVSRAFSGNGFSVAKTAKPMIVRISGDFDYRSELLDPGNWYFTMGDSIEIF
jgi:hypothetical protein